MDMINIMDSRRSLDIMEMDIIDIMDSHRSMDIMDSHRSMDTMEIDIMNSCRSMDIMGTDMHHLLDLLLLTFRRLGRRRSTSSGSSWSGRHWYRKGLCSGCWCGARTSK